LKLIAGLGNPGPEYQGTRHNLGFAVLDELARRHGVSFRRGPLGSKSRVARLQDPDAWLAMPQTYMNRSGQSVGSLCRWYRIEPVDLLVVVDEVDLPLGRLRARPGGSAGGHKGLKSVIESLGTNAFARLRIGVGRGDDRRDLADHVLSRFDAEESAAALRAVERAADAAEMFRTDGIDRVMNAFNRSEDEPRTRNIEPGT
jgi:PTH1 family peptidyl-tRNA hydrolase